MCPKTVSCNKCSYVQRHKHDDIFDPPEDNDETFSSSYFLKEPIETVESIVTRLEDINTERIQAGCPDNIPPEDIQVIIGDEKNDNNDRIDDEKEASFPDDTTPDDMDVVNDDDKNDKKDKRMMKKMKHTQMTLLLMIWRLLLVKIKMLTMIKRMMKKM